MSFDKDTRNLLAKTVTACRHRLIGDVTDQLRGVFGLHPDGTVLQLDKLTHLSPDQAAAARRLRDLLNHYTASAAGKESDRRRAAHERMVLEISFTTLNRLAALRLCEERGLVVKCVRRGMASDGFRLFERISGGALGERYGIYRVFLECMFDELALDLGVLFDRLTPQSAVFPTERCMEDVLAELNKPELTPLWTEDETIGWVYQYFNPPEERKAMREASQAPRNSRELAVRNQFFTPRYVVEFLTDNTLGRIWYEMRKGDTILKEECRYLVRRPNEVFLAPGEKATAEADDGADLSQEELLKKLVHIEHRPKKDPRDLRMLDPACGSGHFLLYTFDLLERIYEEAWEDSGSPKSEATGRTLRGEFKTLDDLRRAAPKLIVEHNLHGIDIDPRAVQIAALALWLRAQKAWKSLGLKAAERPRIAKSNIVTAEPMPGEEDMRREFAVGLRPRVLGQLVDVVFDKMKLAGEAGSLLKIEEEIKDAVAKAKKQWLEGPKLEQQLMFPRMVAPRPKQQELRFDFKGVTDERFWEQAEDCILDALKDYAERAENSRAVRRRLFAEDAARSFAFIDLCRKRYDVVLMNPPYGSGSERSKPYLADAYPATWIEVYIAFCERAIELCTQGFVGAITSRTFMYLQKFIRFRLRVLEDRLLLTLVDLGGGILDDATVETAAWVFEPVPRMDNIGTFLDLENTVAKGHDLRSIVGDLLVGSIDQRMFVRILSSFGDGGNCSISYSSARSSQSMVRAGGMFYIAKPGLGTRDDFRFARLRWEVGAWKLRDKSWACAIYGNQNTKFYADHSMVINWMNNGSEMKTFIAAKYGSASRSIINEDVYFKPGLTYQYTGRTFRVHLLPKDCIITMAGQGLYPTDSNDLMALLGILNSPQATIALKEINPGRFFQASYVNSLRVGANWKDKKQKLEAASQGVFDAQRRLSRFDETSPNFCDAIISIGSQKRAEYIHSLLHEIKDKLGYLQATSASYFEVSGEPNFDEGSIVEASIQECDFGLLVGFVFGRWDIRIALDPSLAPNLPDPFDPLPICPPGTLVGPDGLPAEPGRIVSEDWLRARQDANNLPAEGSVKNPTIRDDGYPLRISWDGVLVDDPGWNGGQSHRDDIVRRVREVLDLLWKDKAHEIEQEACDILGVSDLRDYFRRPAGFFQDHLKRYSKSRRKAPIYWSLSTASGSYTVWLYYPRLTDQTLYAAVNKYVEPKIAEVERGMARIEEEVKSASGRDATRLTDRLNEARTFLGELRDLRGDLLRIAALPYRPDLNDGVIINAASLHGFFRLRQWAKATEDCWKKLEKGEYDWAHLAYTIWPDRVRDVCKKDRSIAIAHGLEDLCEIAGVQKVMGVKGRRKRKSSTTED